MRILTFASSGVGCHLFQAVSFASLVLPEHITDSVNNQNVQAEP